MLDTLRYRDFRLIWIATLLSTSSRWMEQVVGGWLVLQLTDSPLWLGIAMAFRTVGWIFGPFVGIAADRMDRRRLLILAQSVNVLQSSLMLGLILSGKIQLWEILALAFVNSIAAAIDWPTRTLLMAELVDKPLLTNAMAFNRMAQDVTQIAGPILGGSFIALFDFQGAYALIVAITLSSVIMTTISRSPPFSTSKDNGSIWEDLKQGAGHIQKNRNAQGILWLAAAANFVGFTLAQTLLPIFARDIYKTGPLGLGLFMTAMGAGALIASLAVASRHNMGDKGVIMMASFFIWPALLASVAFSPWYILSLAILVGIGVVQSLTMTTTTSLLIICVPDTMKGRVMGVRTFMIATLPLGNLMAGAGASVMGAQLTTVANGAIMGSIVLAIWLAYRQLGKLN